MLVTLEERINSCHENRNHDGVPINVISIFFSDGFMILFLYFFRRFLPNGKCNSKDKNNSKKGKCKSDGRKVANMI